MFGMVVATGLKVLAESHASRGDGRNNLFIVAVSVVVGMIPMLNAKIFSALPPWLSPFYTQWHRPGRANSLAAQSVSQWLSHSASPGSCVAMLSVCSKIGVMKQGESIRSVVVF